VTGPDFEKSELLPVIAQDDATGDVLMLAWMNREAYEETLRTGRVCYYSRSRQKLWR
jgi:phosphoribosyl-AMP cyclohydrolase